MKRRILFKETMTMARTGDAESFKSFYILTVSDTFGKVFELVEDRQQAEDLLVEIYLSLYQQADTLPIGEEDLNYRIEEEIYRVAEKSLGMDPDRKIDDRDMYEKLNEERAATLWMQIEEITGLNKEETEEDDFWKTYIQTSARITVAAIALVFSILLLIKGWDRVTVLKEGLDTITASLQAPAPPVPTETVEQKIIIEEEKQTPGWQQDSDKKLYYVKKDGVPADGQIAIGKQIMTFSRDGELILIGNNQEVAVNMNLSFDEDARYEVRDGNVYRSAPNDEERCVVRNGHVIQADVRCGYLWYVCQYQIPNSEEIKTTVYRALPDGEMEEEVYSTRNILDMNSFQVTSDWYYYLSEGRLFRKNLTDGRTEYLAEDIEYYFAWEDMAYYMKDRFLETVSVGYSYSGVEAGYQIERNGAGFVLLDSTGAVVPESGNGEIQIGDRIYQIANGVISSVSSADRKDGNVTYYIDWSGTEPKIYWKDEVGTSGLLSQEGLRTDAFCIAGEWLYYSSIIQKRL